MGNIKGKSDPVAGRSVAQVVLGDANLCEDFGQHVLLSLRRYGRAQQQTDTQHLDDISQHRMTSNRFYFTIHINRSIINNKTNIAATEWRLT